MCCKVELQIQNLSVSKCPLCFFPSCGIAGGVNQRKETFLIRANGRIPFAATVLQLLSLSRINFYIKRQRVQNERLRWLNSDQYRGGSFQTGVVECVPSNVSDLSVWISSSTNSVLCAWSDPRKRSETLLSMNTLTPSASTSAGLLVGLAILCLSALIGLTCSLYVIPSTQEGQTSALKPHQGGLFNFFMSIFCS